MKYYIQAALLAGAPIMAALPAQANDRFEWDGEVELGFDSVYKSDNPANEGDTAFAVGEFGFSYALGANVSAFGGLTLEDVTGNSDYGFYIGELGLEFDLGNTTVQLGKITPSFGTAWDNAAGYFASALAEDYELTEQIGATAAMDLSGAGTLSFGMFFADTTVLSESAGFNRGRNSRAAGGAGNTGQLDNIALQWSTETDSSYYYIGARHLSAGAGDVSDETGFVAGFGHSFGNAGLPIDVFAELATFDGYGGTADDATYATLSAAYGIENWSFSLAYSKRDISSLGVTDQISLGADYEFDNGVTVGGALALIDDAGVKDRVFGISAVFPLGG